MTLESRIEEKLSQAFSPRHLDVINETPWYINHSNKESHIKVIIVSDDFSGERVKNRHKAITQLLASELCHDISALALHTYTEKEWQDYYVDDMALSSTCLTGERRAS